MVRVGSVWAGYCGGLVSRMEEEGRAGHTDWGGTGLTTVAACYATDREDTSEIVIRAHSLSSEGCELLVVG